jgi:murein DD-endopeptidase MepM/ murein hydrolase activator NlpD
MRTVPTVFRSADRSVTIATRLGLLALLGGGLGACSNIDMLRSPVYTGSTANQQQIISGTQSPLGNTYYGPQVSSVQGQDLPPPSGSASVPAYTPAPAYAETSPAYQPAPSYGSGPNNYQPGPSYGSAQQGPRPYTPPASYSGATSPRPVQLASAEPAPMRLGKPPTTLNAEAARIQNTQTVPAYAATGGGTHVVAPGDTAWNISQRYGITVDQLAAANGGSTTVRIGERLTIPGGHGRAAEPRQVQLASLNPSEIPQATSPAPMPQVPAAVAMHEAAPQMQSAQQPRPAEQQVAFAPQTGNAGSLAPIAPQAGAPAAMADAGAGFRWPVRGRVISGFGKKANGERNDGINLAVPEGTSVKAAEDGVVIYAGNELKSYGNLVLIRHANGWVSAYAHNSKLEVKRGDNVKRGQVIALSGMSGGVTTPQVHFELRKDATPVDPLQHLSDT